MLYPLIYKVNEKTNTIAPKITDKSITIIKSEMNTNIIETVDGIIFMVLNETGVSIEGAKYKILKLINGVIDLNSPINKISKKFIEKLNESGLIGH